MLLTVSKIYLIENKGAETELTVKPEVDLVACNEPHSGQLSLHWRQCGGERRELWGLWLNKETDTESDQKINPRGDESKVLIARDPFSLRVTGGNKMFPLLEEEVRRRWGGGIFLLPVTCFRLWRKFPRNNQQSGRRSYWQAPLSTFVDVVAALALARSVSVCSCIIERWKVRQRNK